MIFLWERCYVLFQGNIEMNSRVFLFWGKWESLDLGIFLFWGK
ncbi:hypothetical protein BAOM_1338 [Peribacillus asahii]|uniref:Uncharacterized protein n=1 Tax=Peribacillus asahii TaxID=228899 RepID=A0A3T0KNX7_9BACI|nr:hypothetical protein BAOM_1338 [Peribacillus asahii]